MKYLKNVASLNLDAEKCVGCGACLAVCPHEVFALENGKAHVIDLDACMECGACAKNCPVEALRVKTGVGCASGILSSVLGGDSACCGSQGCCGR